MISFILLIKLIVTGILVFLIFFSKNEWLKEESGFCIDSGRRRLPGEWWTWDRHLFLTSLKVPYLIQLLHWGSTLTGVSFTVGSSLLLGEAGSCSWGWNLCCHAFAPLLPKEVELRRQQVPPSVPATSPDCSTGVTFVLRNKCVTYVWHTYQVFKLLPESVLVIVCTC